MSIRKRNEYLDGEESDEELQNGLDSEDERGRGAIGGQSNKKRRLNKTLDESADEDGEEDEVGVTLATSKISNGTDDRFDFSKFDTADKEELGDVGDDQEEDSTASNHDRARGKNTKLSAAKQAERAQKLVRKSGVIYISRVPPFMKPQTLKHFLEPHARKGLGRIFLTPEDHVAHSQRVKNGGNKKKSFTDGWVEFTSKTEAKIAAEMLNGNIIGGKKGNFYHDDLWNIKYLKGFKWHHLTEQIANENAERAARIREEIRRSRKENKAFVEDIERAKMLEGMENKKEAKRRRDGILPNENAHVSRASREFKQKKAKAHAAEDTDSKPAPQVNEALRKIF